MFFGIMILGSNPFFCCNPMTHLTFKTHSRSPNSAWSKSIVNHLVEETSGGWAEAEVAYRFWGFNIIGPTGKCYQCLFFFGIRRKDKNLIKSTLPCEFLVDSIWRSICCCGKPKPRPEMCEDLTVSLKSDKTRLRGPASFQRPSVGLGLFPGAVRGCLHFSPKMARWWRTWVLGEFQSLWNWVSQKYDHSWSLKSFHVVPSFLRKIVIQAASLI